MALKAGTLENISGSMAEMMEQVFRDALPSVVPGADASKGETERRLIFVAVAQGVVRHLAENPDAFQVEVSLTNGAGAVKEIQST